jgi:hypothetical protein
MFASRPILAACESCPQLPTIRAGAGDIGFAGACFSPLAGARGMEQRSIQEAPTNYLSGG